MAENKLQILKVPPSMSVWILGLMLGLAAATQLGVAGDPSVGGAAGARLGGGDCVERVPVPVPGKSGESATGGSLGIIGGTQY